MIYPSADTIEEKVGSRYSLVVIAAKRAKQIKEGAPVLIDTTSTNPLTIALEEIAAGKVTVAQPRPETPQINGSDEEGMSLDNLGLSTNPANTGDATVDIADNSTDTLNDASTTKTVNA